MGLSTQEDFLKYSTLWESTFVFLIFSIELKHKINAQLRQRYSKQKKQDVLLEGVTCKNIIYNSQKINGSTETVDAPIK